MNFKKACFILPLIVLCLLAGNINAWDGQRKGLIMEGGFGLGGSYFYSKIGNMSNNAARLGPAYSFKVGYAKTNRTMVYLSGKLSMAYFDKIVDAYDSYFDTMGDDTIIGIFAIIFAPIALPLIPLGGSHSVLGVGGTYYFNETAPSYFVEGSMGAGIIPDEFDNDVEGGFGMSLAGGYEFKPHWNIRGDLLIGIYHYKPGEYDSDDSKKTNVALSLVFTVNWMVY